METYREAADAALAGTTLGDLVAEADGKEQR